MSVAQSYRTIGADATAEITERRSRFICTLRRVESVEAARDVVAHCRSAFHQARHHCSAMVIGPDGALQHTNDDGEPSGTAGAPMLQALLGAEVSDVVAVVTRYFGGVLLGTGGLARAYAAAVRAALDSAPRVMRALRTEAEVHLDHGTAGRVEAALREDGVDVADVEYGVDVTLRVAVPDVSELTTRLALLTGGAAAPRVVGTRWVDLPARLY